MTGTMTLLRSADIAQTLIDDIGNRAAAEWPHECCGLLIGAADRRNAKGAIRITRAVPARNLASDPAISFEIDPAVLFATHREVRIRNEAIIGCYHSHPNGVVEPSATDLARAEEPGFLWMIVGTGAEGVTGVALFQRCPVTDVPSPAKPRHFREIPIITHNP